MHSLICGFALAVMALFPGSAGEGGLNLRAWMESYEKYLFDQMEENFKREQETSEEAQYVLADRPVPETVVEVLPQSVPEETPDSRPEVVAPEPQAITPECELVTPLFSVNGAVLDIGVQEYLYQRLCERGISWFMPYAILMAYQESRFNIYALNQKNLMDSGLFQMRSIYWPEFCAEAGVPCGDIFDPYLQIDVLTFFMARRASWGKTVSEMISAHSQSDYGGYSQEYVDQVMAHQSGLVRVR